VWLGDSTPCRWHLENSFSRGQLASYEEPFPLQRFDVWAYGMLLLCFDVWAYGMLLRFDVWAYGMLLLIDMLHEEGKWVDPASVALDQFGLNS
jgi:hypothetical protein